MVVFLMDETDDKGVVAPSGSPGWLLPLVSMMTMLLAICILLLSISRPDELRLAEVVASIRNAFGLTGEFPVVSRVVSGGARPLQEAIEFEQAVQLVRIKERLESMQSRLPSAQGLEVKPVEEGFLVRLSRAALFPEGSLAIRPEALPLLKQMAELFAKLPNTVRIDSHAGDARLPVAAPVTSLWALTAAEAATLADYFVTAGGLDPARLVATGHHPSRDSASGGTRGSGIEILLSREMRTGAAASRPVQSGDSSSSAVQGAPP
nr:OmpA/MotB domain protein [uncultured bacterium]